MKKVDTIRSFVSILMIFFLLASIVCNSIDSVGSKTTTHELVGVKNPNSHSKPTSQLPEKVESENDHKHQSNFFFIHRVGEFLPFGDGKLRRTFYSNHVGLCGNIPGIPLYLSNLAILI